MTEPVEQLPELREFERTWLTAVRRCATEEQCLDDRALMIELREKLPPGFVPSDVRSELFDGRQITALGLHALDDKAPELRDLERLFHHVKELLIKEPTKRVITSAECAEALGVDEKYAARLLGLSATLGSYWSQGSGHPQGCGYSSINIQEPAVLARWLRFRDLKSVVREHAKRIEEGRSSLKGRTWIGSNVTLTPVQDFYSFQGAEPAEVRVAANSAFIIMSMNPEDPMLVDVCREIKTVCSTFGITARRIDDVEHSGVITDRILSLIRASDLVIADLTGERPNVYYEIGYAQAYAKKPILYRRKGTPLHFDLMVHNAPEYTNATDLGAKLDRRLREVLGRSPRPAEP